MNRHRLERLMRPQIIAVIGGSSREDSPGYSLVRNLGSSFNGELYVVNPKYREVQGYPCYHRLSQAPHPPDVAVICTPGRSLIGLLDDCGQAGVAGVVVLSAIDLKDQREKQRLFEQMKAKCRSYGMRLIGPSSLGVIQPHAGIRATMLSTPVLPGKLALITQSGAMGTAILDWAHERRIGFSHVISVGALIDISFADLIDYFGIDPYTSAILIYLEDLSGARRFLSAARAFAIRKPILLLRAGRHQEPPAVLSSEVNPRVAKDDIYRAAFQRAGILRVDTISQLFHCAQALASQRPPQGSQLAIVSNAGGPALLAADYLTSHGGRVVPLDESTRRELLEGGTLLRSANTLTSLARSAGPEDYEQAIRAALATDAVDGLVVLYSPFPESDPTAIAKAVVEATRGSRKTILSAWMGGPTISPALEVFEAAQIPHYPFPEQAVNTFLRMYQYRQNLLLLQEMPEALPLEQDFRTREVEELFGNIRKEGRMVLSEAEARQVLRAYHIPDNPYQLVQSLDEAVETAEAMGYPVVLKVASPNLAGKRSGGLRLNLQDAEEVRMSYQSLMFQVERLQDPGFQGILVERMIDKEFELLLASQQDDVFGSVLVVGRGGRGAHLYPDLQVGLPPLNQALARRVIERLRIFPLLEGQDSTPGIDLFQLEMAMVRCAYLLTDFPEIQRLEVNPFVINDEGGVALHAHIEIAPAPPVQKRPYAHLVISPYPVQYTRSVTVKGGREMLLRPMRPEDEPLVEELIDRSSRETLYNRFFGQVPTIDHQFLTRFTQNDYDREIAIVALEQKEDGNYQMCGVVRIVSEPLYERAEYAILIGDPWQGLGLGSTLTSYILEIARDRGLQKVHGTVLSTNKAMIHLFKKFDFELRNEDFETYVAEKVL